ncbi:MAG: DUF1963 domain-containing protein [Pseudomonadales bacterium]|nr:DUF1963 domain-containing protein [Pseudomonadales bacterium]
MTTDFSNYVQQHSREALLVSKVFSDTHSNSFFGGRPLMPEGMEWPKSEVSGKLRSMPFLGQINLSDIKDFQILPDEMPTEGILYFFYNEALNYGGNENAPCVLYCEDTKNLVPRDQPEPHSSIIGKDELAGGFAHRAGKATYHHFPRLSYPKYEVDFAAFKDIQHPDQVLSRKEELKFKDDYLSIMNIEVENALKKIYGESFNDHTDVSQFPFLKVLDPNKEATGCFDYQESSILSGLVDSWPQAWIHIGLLISSSEIFCQGGTNFNKGGFGAVIPDDPDKDRFIQECEHWLNEAKKNPFTRVPEDQKLRFLNWASQHYQESFRKWDQDRSQVLHKKILYFFASLQGAAFDATNLCLELEQSKRDLLTVKEKEAYIKQTTSEPHVYGFHAKHQMFGFGYNAQGEAEANVENVLLLQIVY